MVDAGVAATSPIAGAALPDGKTLLRTVGPRLLLDILGPPIAFYAVWKATDNLLIGVAVGTIVSVLILMYERMHGRPGLIALVVLGLVLVQAVVGIATDSAAAYLVGPPVLGAVNGVLWLGSVALGRPLAGAFAREVIPVDDETRASPEYLAVFSHVSLLFGIFFIVFAAIQLAVLSIVGVGAFVATRVLDSIGILVMIIYCMRYISSRLALPAELESS